MKADPLEPGGDGLVVYVNGASVLVFRLWEIKKHASQALVSATINLAQALALYGGLDEASVDYGSAGRVVSLSAASPARR
ncbi:hypothetical protein ACPSM1_19500 [Micromonospora chersina]|uniref:hypothetical protein n=1 Tax=Micromonospora chersina TaxID=47854 RepID=UPI003C9C8EE8